MKAAIRALKEDADALSDQLGTLAGLRDQYQIEQKSFVGLKASRKSEQATLDALLASKKSAQASLSGKNARESRQQKKLSVDARDLVALIGKLELKKQERLKIERQRIEREIRRQEQLRLAETKRRMAEAKRRVEEKANQDAEKKSQVAAIPTPAPSRKSNTSAGPAQESQAKKAKKTPRLASLSTRHSFSSAKGTLALPVGGKIISKYSAARAVGKRNGIVIETPDNATVVSPYDGQIAFAGPFRHYGLLLIIDHGEGYHTLLAGMGSIEGVVGQLLLAGEPVGQMKSSKSEKPALYMELRVKGSPVNPIPWLAAGNRKVSG